MISYLVLFLLFFLPFVVIPIGVSPFETPKVVITEIMIELILIFKMFQFRRINFKEIINPQFILVSILFILSIITQFIFQPKEAFFGNVYRLQGLFLFWHLLLFSILAKYIKLPKNHKFIYHLSLIFLFFGTLILGVYNNRAFATLGEPNALAATALFIFPFVWFNNKPLIGWTSLFMSLLIIILSSSRAGFIGLLLEILFIFLTQKLKIPSLISTFACLLIIGFSLYLPFLQRIDGFEDRAEIWQVAINAGLTSPLIGKGFGNIQSAFHQTAVLSNNHLQYQIVDSAHNFLLDFWVQGGLVGVISILLILFLTFQHFIKTKKIMETATFLGIITAMLFNPVSVVNLLAFWWLIGQGFDK